MSLNNYLNKKSRINTILIKDEATSKNEIRDLFNIVKRDIKDCKEARISNDWQFGIAYNAALKLCTILVRADGKRISSGSHHFLTILSLPYYMEEKYESTSNYLNRCRKKRNKVEYDCVGGVGPNEVEELISFIEEFHKEIEAWMYANHPELM